MERKPGMNQGFTLVEVLIVIVILSVLATVVVMSVRGVTDQGEESVCTGTLTPAGNCASA